jgi:hypothetical protein
MISRVVWAFVGICAVGTVLSFGQASSAEPSSVASATFGLGPEDAYLTPTRYTNAYFGLRFDFPDGLQLRPVPMPAALNRRIQLLDMASSAGKYAALTFSAYEYKSKNYTDAKSLLRRELEQEIFTGVEQIHGVAKATVGDKPFFYYEARKGAEQHVMFAGEMSGYVLTADFRARDAEVLHRMVAAFSAMEFFPPQEARRRAGQSAAAYQGPAISEQHLREVREAKPADHLDPGKVAGGVYENAQIGITYKYPAGWNIEPAGAIEPAIERYREYVSGEPLLGPRERAVVKACRKTLLSVWRTHPGADGLVSYDDFGEVTLSAMPLSCFPNVRFPSDPRDAAAVREFVLGMQFTQPIQRDMNEASTYEAGGRPFVLTRGTIAYKTKEDALSRRVSVALAMTQQRGYLLIWLFAAPHDSELRELLHAKVGFVTQAESSGATQQDAGPPGEANWGAPGGMQATPASSAPGGASASVNPSPLLNGDGLKGESAPEQKLPPTHPN